MAYVETQPNGRYRARYRDPSGKLRSKTFRRKLDAERYAARMTTDLDAGGWIDPKHGRIPLADWSTLWRPSKVDLRVSSQARLDSTVKHVLAGFGDVQLRAISNSAVRAWVTKLSGELSASSVRKAYFALSQMLAAAVADRRIAHNPCDDVPLPTEEYGDQRYLDPGDVAALADTIYERYRALVLIAAWSGLRFGECAALRRSRVDLLRGRVAVAETLSDVNGRLSFGPPKTKNGRRMVPLPRQVLAEVADHLETFTASDVDALVFTTTTGKPLRRSGFRRSWWQPAVRAAGLEPLRFHELRHTFVALSILAGADAKQVSVRAGHSSVAFTLDRYGHLYEHAEDRVTDRLSALYETSAAAAAAAGAEVVRLR